MALLSGQECNRIRCCHGTTRQSGSAGRLSMAVPVHFCAAHWSCDSLCLPYANVVRVWLRQPWLCFRNSDTAKPQSKLVASSCLMLIMSLSSRTQCPGTARAAAMVQVAHSTSPSLCAFSACIFNCFVMTSKLAKRGSLRDTIGKQARH